MQPRIMITNDGPHPAEKLAAATAWKIVELVRVPDEPVSADLPEMDRLAVERGRDAARQAKAQIEPRLAAILEAYHEAAQDHERGALHDKGDEHLIADLDGDGRIDLGEVVLAVSAVMTGSPFAAHFAKPEVVATIGEMIRHDFAASRAIERAWFADGTASPAGKRWHDKHFRGAKHDPESANVRRFRERTAAGVTVEATRE